jgi:hypothetical protein
MLYNCIKVRNPSETGICGKIKENSSRGTISSHVSYP